MSAHPASAHAARRGRFAGRIHVPFVGLAFFLGVFGGLLLAVTLPATAALRGSITAAWAEHAQVHGHLQAVGFVGLFIVGMSYRMLPGFTARQFPYPRLPVASFWLLALGIVARAVGQPLGDIEPLAWLTAASAWLELAGLVLFSINVLALALPAARKGQAFGLYFSAGATWFVVQAALAAWWLTELASAGGTLIPAEEDRALVFLQFFGVHLLFILGVGLRAFPVFFAAGTPPRGQVAAAFALAQAGLLLSTAAFLVEAAGGAGQPRLQGAGFVLLGVGLAWAATFTGFWRPPSRIRPASRPSAYLLQPAMAWLVAAALLLAGLGARAALEGAPVPFAGMDAVRHIVGVGVVLTTIVGMAQMVLPEFAGERLLGRQAAWRGKFFGALLVTATVLRAGSRLLAGSLPGDLVYWSMSVAGLLAFIVVAMLGFYFVRGVRSYGLVLEAAVPRASPPQS